MLQAFIPRNYKYFHFMLNCVKFSSPTRRFFKQITISYYANVTFIFNLPYTLVKPKYSEATGLLVITYYYILLYISYYY